MKRHHTIFEDGVNQTGEMYQMFVKPSLVDLMILDESTRSSQQV